MKVWNQEIEACWMCPYYDAPKNKHEKGWLCTVDDHNLENWINSTIHKDCPFNKSINREAIESFGFIYYKIHPGTTIMEFEAKEYLLTYEPDFKNGPYVRIAMEGEGDVTLFSGTLNNAEELKFILTRLNIIK